MAFFSDVQFIDRVTNEQRQIAMRRVSCCTEKKQCEAIRGKNNPIYGMAAMCGLIFLRKYLLSKVRRRLHVL